MSCAAPPSPCRCSHALRGCSPVAREKPPGVTGYSTRLSLLVAAALFFLSAFPDPAPAQTVSFIARRDLAAGRSPDSVAVGDFNGDGRLDLATANFDSNSTTRRANLAVRSAVPTL